MSSEDWLYINVDTSVTAESKSAWPKPQETIRRGVAEVREALTAEGRRLGEMLNGLDETVGQYRCEEVELTVEFTAEGGFRLVGNATVSASATLLLRFRRRPRTD